MIFLSLVMCIVMQGSALLTAQVRVPAVISDNMVIQRDAPVKIWGWAAPGEKVKVSFRGHSNSTRAGENGKWMVNLRPSAAGGPFSMEIKASNTIVLKDILVGDVWFCSGQSNMVHYLGIHNERYAEEIASANYPEIRQFLVPAATSLEGPAEDVKEVQWEAADPESVNRFSVVAYFFALKLYEKYHVPIGLINASVGGTPIEAWTSEEGLKDFPDQVMIIERNRDTAYINGTNRAVRERIRGEFRTRSVDKGTSGPLPWYDTSFVARNWHNITIPGYWEDQGIKDLDGVVWYRKVIEVPAAMTGVPAKIAMGRIVDADKVYINGVLVGSTSYQYPQRRYEFGPGILKAGKNVVVVRVANNFGKGGFVPDKPYFLAASGDTLDLKGDWKYRVGEVYSHGGGGFEMGFSAQNQPAALFNGMVAPFTSYKIKGIIWYQGESNAERPERYRELLPAFISDWRQKWDQGEIPFLNVQLPNFMDVNYSPEESNWALVREAQLATLDLPNTGLAVTIDLGEWNDIHPDRKKPVGERLALAAMKIGYGEKDIVYSGPLLRSTMTDGDKIILTFDHAGSGLVSGKGEELDHFAIAGEDKRFVWGNAVIENDSTVVVWNENIPSPLYVRYAWADNPRFANLYNKEGLPASPFRTDR